MHPTSASLNVNPGLSRRSLLRLGSVCAVAGIAGGGLAAGTAAPAQATPTLSWHPLRVLQQAGSITSIATDGSIGWAVGNRGEAASGDLVPMAMRLTGGVWRPTTRPAPDGASLSSVAIVSATEVWAVGEKTIMDSADSNPVVVRWNGTSWKPVPFPATIGGLSQVVAAGGKIWVAGWASVDGREHGVVYRYSGGRWTLLDKGLTDTTNVNCLQVLADGTVWAGLNPGMARLVGGSWQLSPEWPADGSWIPTRFIATSSRNVWVAGVAYTGSGVVPLIAHFNGTRWARRSVPDVQGQLYDLEFRVDQVVAVGERFADDGTVTQLLLAQDGSTFALRPGPVATGGGLLTLAGMSGELLTGGYRGTVDPAPFSAISAGRRTL